MKRPCSPMMIVALAATQLCAMSGFGVASRMDGGAGNTYAMYLYKITNNHVDTGYQIYTDPNFYGNPRVINTHGTHVAFLRTVATSPNLDTRIAVMRLSNPSKYVDIVSFGKDGLSDGSGMLSWPQGDWVYFATAPLNKYIYRVNVQTREVQFVAWLRFNSNTDNFYGREVKMSTVNYRMGVTGGPYFTLQQAQAGVINSADYWPSGGAFTIQGCGHSISASGTMMGNQVDPGHYTRIISRLDWQAHQIVSTQLFSCKTRNQWSLDKKDPVLACSLHVDPSTGSDSGLVESIGVGSATFGDFFSVNSDAWECLVSGWSPGGREQGNGGNIVLVNYRDGIALNVTRNPRRAVSGSSPEPQCHIDPNWYFSVSPSFFVTAPVSDILPELQADATSDYKVPGLDDNTQFPALTMMPTTPAGGLPVVPVGVSRPGRMWVGGGAGAAFGVWGGRSSLRVVYGVCQAHTVAVFDAHGVLVARRSGAAGSDSFTARDGIRPGVHLLRVETRGQCVTAAVTVL